MRILITGGFGFIGGRLAQHLSYAGNKIVLGSRIKRSAPDWLPKAEVVRTDWRNSHSLEQICKGVDLVIHAAGMNAQDCNVDEVGALEMNGLGTARLIAAAVKTGVPRFMYFSTAHVYSSPLNGIITEYTCPTNLHPYATSHLSGEHVVTFASHKKRIESYILRLSNAFGVPIDKNVNCWMLLVNDLCRQVVETGKMVLKTSGRQYRDFISMSDVCNVVETLSRAVYCDDNNIINVGAGRSISIYEMALVIQKCYWLMYNHKPYIHINGSDSEEEVKYFEYKTDSLKHYGCKVSVNYSREINSLLQYCREWFCDEY